MTPAELPKATKRPLVSDFGWLALFLMFWSANETWRLQVELEINQAGYEIESGFWRDRIVKETAIKQLGEQDG